MNLGNIRKAFSARILKALDVTHGALFSAANLSDAMKVYKHATQGQHYHPELGVYGTFNPDNEHGQTVISEAKHKLTLAKAAYDRIYGEDEQMIGSDHILKDELGLNG